MIWAKVSKGWSENIRRIGGLANTANNLTTDQLYCRITAPLLRNKLYQGKTKQQHCLNSTGWSFNNIDRRSDNFMEPIGLLLEYYLGRDLRINNYPDLLHNKLHAFSIHTTVFVLTPLLAESRREYHFDNPRLSKCLEHQTVFAHLGSEESEWWPL